MWNLNIGWNNDFEYPLQNVINLDELIATLPLKLHATKYFFLYLAKN